MGFRHAARRGKAMPACSTTSRTHAPPTARFEVFIGAGYTDLITPYLAPSYLVNQLPRSRAHGRSRSRTMPAATCSISAPIRAAS